MMCLTICQSYAHLICTPAEELRDGDVPKRVENRTWPTAYRGALLIHAGKSKKWLRPGDESRYPEMLYGYVLGKAELIACIPVQWKTAEEAEAGLPARFKWIARHQHAGASGYWWVLENVVRFGVPVPARGQQGLFDLPGDWEEKRVEKTAALAIPARRPRMIKLGE